MGEHQRHDRCADDQQELQRDRPKASRAKLLEKLRKANDSLGYRGASPAWPDQCALGDACCAGLSAAELTAAAVFGVS